MRVWGGGPLLHINKQHLTNRVSRTQRGRRKKRSEGKRHNRREGGHKVAYL